MANKTDGEVEKSIISSDMKIKGKITVNSSLMAPLDIQIQKKQD